MYGIGIFIMAPLVMVSNPKVALGGACAALFVVGSGLSTLDVAALPYIVCVLGRGGAGPWLTYYSPSVALLNGKNFV